MEGNDNDNQKKPTFAKVTNPLSVDGGTMFVNVGHKELAEMSDDRPSNPLVCDPFNN
jgi:hypothetical protein